MAEISFEVRGAGFIDGYPGEYANCRAVFDADTRQLLRIEPLVTTTVSGQDEASAVLEAAGGVISPGGFAMVGESPGPELYTFAPDAIAPVQGG